MKYVDIVDENNNMIGEKVELTEVFKTGLWHREVSVFVINENGEILIQKRANTKKRKPNMWTVCSGIVESEEDVIAAAMRKLHNELVMQSTIYDLELIEIGIESNKLENEKNNNFRYIYWIKTDRKIEDYPINPEEIAKLKYISIEELGKIIEEKDPNVTFSNQDYMDIVYKQLQKRVNQIKENKS